ncbi:Prenyltransferase and squalene oxidase repeat protein [Polystyrenella longa]|uniref:Prenyltransferase and squalene oxidase repeat protein n=1 Tax=Polystyrenella longa TaxID=2528007 RepID=A0A518CK49_9PLAN|nr:prenyltransferase/squalene oxidase repeat-containing protein [Polystyrenella longa]QDU79605.1 Prenyltransferase and squalene oxidase repeat protein [Polystyrenella longa]
MDRFTLTLLFILFAIFPFANSSRHSVFGQVPNDQIDEAIARGLQFLSQAQEKDHSWKIDSFGSSTAATSLSVMAFMASGQSPGEGPYGQQIEDGILWVLDHQLNGMLVHKKSHGPFYSHGISTLMLAEAVGMLKQNGADAQSELTEERCRKALEEALEVILKAQNVDKPTRHAGGWRYQPTSRDSDLSVTGWQLLALRAARNAGCNVPAENIDRAVEYVKRCATVNDPGFAYQPGSNPTATRSGTGILALEICGEHLSPATLRAAEGLRARPLKFNDQYFFYGAYYCSVGMFQMGGRYWTDTRDPLFKTLLDEQQPDGSWLANHGSERSAGKVYCTTMAILALAVEYQYLPIYQR